MIDSMPIRFAGRTDVGLVRERNEDALLVFPEQRLIAVADGMGGHQSGDVASALAIATLREFYAEAESPDRTWPCPYDGDLSEEENCMVAALRLANRKVFARARRSNADTGMGTTIVALSFAHDGREVIVGHVGDSRCYRVRDGQLTQLTSDHSLVTEVSEIAPWLSQEEKDQLPRNVVTRALGMAPDVVVDLLTTTAEPADRYLLCSDGLTEMLSDEEILGSLAALAAPEDTCTALLEAANAAGGIDNTTVVMAEVA